MIRKLFIGGNWKSNNTLKQTKDLVEKIYNIIPVDASKVGKWRKYLCVFTNFGKFWICKGF